ncbi:MAG: response regulator [Deltaproteobacteria bacterium]|nr:response regulator [Deltaproteobacteria bacterium]
MLDKNERDRNYPHFRAILKSTERAAQLVRQLLLFSRKIDSEKKLIDLNLEMEQGRRILERTIPRMIQINLHLEGRLWKVKADPVQIEQVLLNLGINAADAMPEGGRLAIETRNITLDQEYARNHLDTKAGNYVLLTISDTGCGMDKETVARVFEPFFTTKEIGRGTGLGLASVYGIVKNHGGNIICYSEPNQGTTFKIYLPAIEQLDESAEKIAVVAPFKGGPETILLVDDETQLRDFALQALKRFGYDVMTASSGEEALEIYMAQPRVIDLVILDIGMPGMGGHKCLREILKVNPAAKVVIASGYSVNGQLKKTLDAGAVGFIGKPYQMADLLNKVRKVLDEGK